MFRTVVRRTSLAVFLLLTPCWCLVDGVVGAADIGDRGAGRAQFLILWLLPLLPALLTYVSWATLGRWWDRAEEGAGKWRDRLLGLLPRWSRSRRHCRGRRPASG